jgi:RNA polymerase sigma-70 factor (ECF subfamily)
MVETAAGIASNGTKADLARAVAGDDAAFARIVAEHHIHVARVVFVACGDPDLAEQAEQAAWATAWRRLATLRDPAKLRPWLIAIAANELRQLVRGRSRRTVREITVDVPETRAMDPDRARILDLTHALRRLEQRDRVILALRYVAGFESAEIGRVVGMSAPGVRARTGRLLDRLREDLRDE